MTTLPALERPILLPSTHTAISCCIPKPKTHLAATAADARSTLPSPASLLYCSNLHSSQVMLSAEGVTEVQEEYVETQYYNELQSIDKQHHTTGNGFIRVVGEEGEGGYDIQLQEGTGGMAYTGFRSNPATNDWVPNIDEDQGFVSSKPNRSESS